ncbi:hypothetical protein GCM10027155_10120 [Acinetobacter apis]|uniref:Uncharacterized protein n=1 Tax=Acinetobacter apis TaxID=1229165 RepID=A0A217EFV8_9GAMM|nr:hypothetical protein [Acinetobacter apis]SNQ29090.1 hypothetical protein SAMN05444584_1024 [Acinetobacter apis]
MRNAALINSIQLAIFNTHWSKKKHNKYLKIVTATFSKNKKAVYAAEAIAYWLVYCLGRYESVEWSSFGGAYNNIMSKKVSKIDAVFLLI